MATHHALQAAGDVVTASAPLSGPYALAAFGDAIFCGHVSRLSKLARKSDSTRIELPACLCQCLFRANGRLRPQFCH
jgi:hypothetical protein